MTPLSTIPLIGKINAATGNNYQQGTTAALATRPAAAPAPAPQPDPAAAPPGPANPNGGSGGSATPLYQDKSNDIAVQNSGLGAVDQQTSSGLAAIHTALSKLLGQYDTESQANETDYTRQSDSNQNALQKNKEASLLGAAQGRRGLYGTLASLGALSGDGLTLADRAVQNGANEDLGAAAENYGTNQSTLDGAIGKFRISDKERRDNASTEADNARTNVNNDAAKSRQQFYSNLSGDYAAEGNSGQAKTFADLAASMYPAIAQTNVPNSNIAYTGAAFTPATLSNYVAGANSTQVRATPAIPGSTGTPSLVAGPIKRK